MEKINFSRAQVSAIQSEFAESRSNDAFSPLMGTLIQRYNSPASQPT